MNDDPKSRWSWFKADQSEAEENPHERLNDAGDQAECEQSDTAAVPPDESDDSLNEEASDGSLSDVDHTQHSDYDPLDDTGDDAESEDESAENDPEHDTDNDDIDDRPKPASWSPVPARRATRRRKRPTSLSKPEMPRGPLTPEQKLLLLDTWQRSGLPARDFAALVNVSRHTLYSWKQKFEKDGPAGLVPQQRGARKGSRMPELTKRAILMMKEAHPDWGCQRISDMLNRGPALPASPGAISKVLHEAGYEMEERPTRRNPDRVRSFERACTNQMWQTDLFSFVLKRQNRRIHLVGFMDDHSRFIVGYGLHASQSAALVIEVLRGALTAWGPPQEILTDNGAQYVTWRGKSQFSKELEKRGIRQIVAKPRRPQTLGKIERFWGTLWRECIESAIFTDLAEARQRIGLFIDYYNFQRPHQGINGLVPSDRFFDAAPEVLRTLKSRVDQNALELARNGIPKKPFYLTGQVDGRPFSVHREGDRVVLRKGDGEREDIELEPPAQVDDHDTDNTREELPTAVTPDGSPSTGWNPPDAEQPPGVSAIDGAFDDEQFADDDDDRESGGDS